MNYVIESKRPLTRQDGTALVVIVARPVGGVENIDGVFGSIVRQNVAPGFGLDQYEVGDEVPDTQVAVL